MSLDPPALPQHVAIIMDGNGRWAQCRNLPRIEGHREGAKSVRRVVRAAREIGLRALTLYAFSAQNWRRPSEEVALLMQLLRDYVIEERDEIMDNGIRLTAIGQVDRLPGFVREPLEALMSDSARNTGMNLCLALSYGGRESLVEAAQQLARAVVAGEMRVEDITEESICNALQTRPLPQLDLLIRTSGEQRLSNFMLWEASYAELLFSEVLWPDFERDDLVACLQMFGQRERRFGLTSDQLRPAIRSVG